MTKEIKNHFNKNAHLWNEITENIDSVDFKIFSKGYEIGLKECSCRLKYISEINKYKDLSSKLEVLLQEQKEINRAISAQNKALNYQYNALKRDIGWL